MKKLYAILFLVALIHTAGSSCEGEAKALYNEVKQKVTSDWDFENREKYKDEAGLKKQRIEAARAIGVAFGNGQQPVTTNITWLH